MHVGRSACAGNSDHCGSILGKAKLTIIIPEPIEGKENGIPT